MPQNTLPTEWLQQLSDPYAVLGIAVTADERRIFQRYHALAKLLHPDHYANNNGVDQELATAIFTRLINPAYDELKHLRKRADIITTLRLEAITWGKSAVSVQNPLIEQLKGMSIKEATSFYEEAIVSYTTLQYQSLTQSYWMIQKLNEFNLAYLYLHTNNSFILEPPHPVIAEAKYQPVVVQVDKTQNLAPTVINYAQRHYQRAIDYSKQGHWSLAVRELRDAIKLEPSNSDYYALLGIVHLRQNYIGMAKVYIRQALKLNPQHTLAVKYASHLKIPLHNQIDPKSVAKALGIAVWLNKFFVKAEANLSQVLKFR
ncbi:MULTISPECIES: J domain-containing protein [unclassified Anabaena]|uniref:J domain-containing protein n=1 Tax=unclassified Anabaena TaxID=2619674 RepID=UPI002B1FF827|nr:DnaJ domain-containing protein [Anabaena sp. UHCC 0399]MEA5566406.1 DnaJ domain-containing protein [Anabaena sp. UHCC 0399]